MATDDGSGRLDLLEVTERVLELGAVYEKLRGYCQSAMGAARIGERRPLVDPGGIEARHDEWEEAVRVLRSRGGVGLAAARPLEEIRAAAATPGRVLDGEELLAVAATARVAVELAGHLRLPDDDYPVLAELGARIPDFGPLVGQIGSLIDDEGEVRDDASSTLTRLRGRRRKLRNRLRERLESLTRDDDLQEALRDPLVSERSGRMVVPVRADRRERVEGIVHDRSSSGQTLWVEPLEAVDDQNRLAELDGEIREEIRSLLAEATAHVRAASDRLGLAEGAIATYDALQALARWAADREATRPLLADDGLVLRAGHHPLVDGDDFVPLDLELQPGDRALVITGPNTGGKTVALKTLGLLAILAQAGIPVPAAELRFRPWSRIHADIGDEQSLEANLSTFSAHLHHIGSFLERQGEGEALVLLDELGTGTDPQEGAALGIALLERFLQRGDWVVASTHHDALKSFAHRQQGALNAAMEFDPESLAPTYRIRIGEPGRSNALDIASRLGFDGELVARARSLLGADAVHLDEVIRELERERKRAGELSERLEARERELAEAREAAERAEKERAKRYEEIEREAREAVREAAEEIRQEGSRKLRDLERQGAGEPDSERARDDRRARWSGEAGQLEGRARRELSRKLEGDRPRASASSTGDGESGEAPTGELVKGTEVEVAPFGVVGTVLSDHEGDEERIEVDVQGKRMVVSRDQLRLGSGGREKRSSAQKRARSRRVRTHVGQRSGVSSELDLHGQTVEQALEKVDKYLDDAILADLNEVRLVHGIGTGALRDAIRAWLAKRPGIASFAPADPMHGGAGVTVVRLAE